MTGMCAILLRLLGTQIPHHLSRLRGFDPQRLGLPPCWSCRRISLGPGSSEVLVARPVRLRPLWPQLDDPLPRISTFLSGLPGHSRMQAQRRALGGPIQLPILRHPRLDFTPLNTTCFIALISTVKLSVFSWCDLHSLSCSFCHWVIFFVGPMKGREESQT